MRTRTTTPMTAAAAFALLLGSLTACAPTPAPTPTPSGYASEEDAFTAAEQTYRAYVDAVNARRADPEAPDPNEYLSGTALTQSIDGARRLDEAGVHIVGPANVASIERVAATLDGATIRACIDSSATRVLDAAAEDVTPIDRVNRIPLHIEVVYTPERTLIIRSAPDGDEPC